MAKAGIEPATYSFSGGPPTPALADYVREHAEEFGVEPICIVLTEHGIKIVPSTYYDNGGASIETGAA